MATKRSKRIDPNAAFAAIVGTPTPEADLPTEVAPAGEPLPIHQVASQPVAIPETPLAQQPLAVTASQQATSLSPEGALAIATTPAAAQPQDALQGQPGPSGATPIYSSIATSSSPPVPQDSIALTPEISFAPQSGPDIPTIQNAPPIQPTRIAPSPAHQPAAEPSSDPKLPLVQKGYYITEEQHRRLGMYAVLQGSDRSAIVRQALEMYFAANRDVLS